MSNMPTNPWLGLFKASSLTRRQEYLSSQGYVSTSRKCGRRGRCSVCAIYSLLFQLPWWAPDGQGLAGSNRQPVSNGHMPVWSWADEGNASKPHQPRQPAEEFSPMHRPSACSYEVFK